MPDELNDATEPPQPGARAKDAAEFAAQWNAHTTKERDTWVSQNARNANEAMNCWLSDHKDRIEDLEARIVELTAELRTATELNA